MREPKRRLAKALSIRGRSGLPTKKAPTTAIIASVLALQRDAGNSAVTTLAQRGLLDARGPLVALQRDGPATVVKMPGTSTAKPSLGWDEDGPNKAGSELVNGMMRYALKGLAGPIDEAIVLVPPTLTKQLEANPKLAVDVLVHLHGYGIGWHARTEAIEKAAGRGLPAVVGTGETRDKALDRLEDQLAVFSKDRPIIGILPQGHGYKSGFGGKAFDRVDLVNNVFAALTELKVSMPAVGGVILSGHSGAGGTFSQTLAKEEESKAKGQRLEELILFDAINGTGELTPVTHWITERLKEDLAELTSPKRKGLDAAKLYLATSPRFRGYCTHNQPSAKSPIQYVDFFMGTTFKFVSVQQTIDRWFRKPEVKALDSDIRTLWKANYTVTDVEAKKTVGHEQMMGTGDRFVEALKR